MEQINGIRSDHAANLPLTTKLQSLNQYNGAECCETENATFYDSLAPSLKRLAHDGGTMQASEMFGKADTAECLHYDNTYLLNRCK